MPISIKYPPTKGDLLYISTSPFVLCWMTYRKHVRVSLKTCTTFRKNTYVFYPKHNHTFRTLMFSDLQIHKIRRLIVWNSSWNTVYYYLAPIHIG